MRINFSRIIPELFKGFLINIEITFFAVLLPVLIGGYLCFRHSVSGSEKRSTVYTVASMFFKCLSPVVICLVALFVMRRWNWPDSWGYSYGEFPMILIFATGLSFCFIMYLPDHYRKEHSLLRNLAVGALDLTSLAYKLSFAFSLVYAGDMGAHIKIFLNQYFYGYNKGLTGESILYILLIVAISAIPLVLIEFAKRFVAEKL